MSPNYARTVLVIMAGIYAIRSTYTILGSKEFEPLSILAAIVFCLTVFLFYRLTKLSIRFLYTVMGLCVVGLAVNSMLLFSAYKNHDNPIEAAFSGFCMFGWLVVALDCGLRSKKKLVV
jgi:hypothetical protein